MDLTLLYYEWIDLAAAAIGLLLGGVFTALHWKGEWTTVRILSALILPTATVMLFALTESGFDSIRIVYNSNAIVLPATGAMFMVSLRKKSLPKRWLIIAIGMMGFAPLAFWMTFVEPRWLDVTTTEVQTDNPGEPIRIVVLSDIQTDQYSGWEDKIAQRTNALNPDIVVLPGDLLQTPPERYENELKRVRRFLKALRPTHGIFIVEGDTDVEPSHYVLGTTARVLRNESTNVVVRGRRLEITGVELNYQTADANRAITSAERSAADVNIVVSHRPAAVTTALVENSNIDLFVAGHTHGGQVSIPGFGPPVTLSALPRDIARGGLGTVGDRAIFVSRGIGLERRGAPRLRLNCRPELALLVLR